jgi:8-oxo-dGTP pyrophosphatase MutT (NUDIX family)
VNRVAAAFAKITETLDWRDAQAGCREGVMSDESSAPLRPRIGCGAAVLDGQGQILLVQRKRQPEAGYWGQPGGKLDWGESGRTCAEREILEELGITIVAGRCCASPT